MAPCWSPCAGLARRQLAALGVAAAWRLGRWGALEGHLAHTRADGAEPGGCGPGAGGDLGLDAEERWEVRLGRLLTAMHRRRAPRRPRACPLFPQPPPPTQ